MHNFKSQKQQQGVTLIELLIALVLGVVVIMGITQGLTNIALSSRLQNNNAQLQSDADSALSFISFKMRNALSTPCERLALLQGSDKLEVHALIGVRNTSDGRAESIDIQESEVIEALLDKDNEGGKQVTLSGRTVSVGGGIGITKKNRSGSLGGISNPSSDDITIVSAEDRYFTSDDVTYASNQVKIAGKFQKGRGASETLYAITDCVNMDVFRASRSENTTGTTLTFASGGNVIRKYPAESSMVSPLDVSQIYVDANKRLINKTLFKNSPGPLMDNVELIRVVFGVDDDFDGIADRYITANQMATLNNSVVISADIYVMVTAPNRDNDVPSSYTLEMPNTSVDISGANLMQTFTITDQIQRKVYMRSVAFRNNATIYK